MRTRRKRRTSQKRDTRNTLKMNFWPGWEKAPAKGIRRGNPQRGARARTAREGSRVTACTAAFGATASRSAARRLPTWKKGKGRGTEQGWTPPAYKGKGKEQKGKGKGAWGKGGKGKGM